MQDAVWLIRATPQGVPAANGVDGHFVLASSLPPVAVSQLHLGGWTPDWDCAEGCLTSALKRRGLPVPTGRVLELEALTNSRYGTGWDGLIHAAQVNGLQPSAVIHGDPPQGFVMNSAWGGVIPPQGFWAYLAASQHMYIELRAPARHTERSHSVDQVILEWDSKQHVFAISADGVLHHKWWADDGKGWRDEQLGSGLNPNCGVSAEVLHLPSETIHVVAQDSGVRHFYWDGAKWQSEAL